MVRGSAGIILVSHVTTVARQAHLDIPGWASRKRRVHTSPHQVYFGPSWLDTCSTKIGDVRPACMFPLVKSKCFLDSGVHRCCKVGHSCRRRVIDCSSVPHKMAWRCVARAIWAVSRLGGPGCEMFAVCFKSWTPPSRCCWRCAGAMSGVRLITADSDQAFEACSAAAVLPAWRHISQS